jgi:hypothetical protein
MEIYLNGYTQIRIESCSGNYVGYPWKIVLHTTESPAGSMPGINRLFQSNPCSTPHFCIDPVTKEKVQYISIQRAAAALRGGRNGYETNRGNVIQVEIIGRANETRDWSDDQLKFIGEFIADIIRAGVPINLDNTPYFPGPKDGTVAVENSRFRFSGEEWKWFDGVCGHVHVPYNDHYDPYDIDIDKIIKYAKDSLGQQTEEGFKVTPEDEGKIRSIVADEIGKALNTLGQWEKDTRALLEDPVIKLDDRPHQFILIATGNGVGKQWIEDMSQRQAFVNAGLIADAAPKVISDPAQKQRIRNIPTIGKQPADF